MISFYKKILVLLLMLSLNACIGLVVSPARVESGLGAVVNNVKEGVQATNYKPNIKFLKKGKACTTNILYLVNSGNSSIEAAKNNGDITNIVSIDRQLNGLGIMFIIPLVYSESCTIVYGE